MHKNISVGENNIKLFRLDSRSELRFHVNNSSNITIELLGGAAEIFGSEMVQNKIYTLSPRSSHAVFTWNGCTLRLTGKVSDAYSVSNNCAFYKLHTELEEHRCEADIRSLKGPVVLVVGPTDVGKSTLCRYLLNYAARHGRKPFFIDLDVGQSSISIPGTIAVLPVDQPADIIEGFSEQNVSIYYYGYKSPGHNMLLYLLLIKALGAKLKSQMKHTNNNSKSSGAIIDTCGWVEGDGYRAIMLASQAFDVNMVFVLDKQELFSKLKHDLSPHIKIVFVPKLSGVVGRSQSVRHKKRDSLVREYFYGSYKSLKPYTFEIKFSDIRIFKAPTSAGKVSIDKLDMVSRNVYPTLVPVGPELLYHVLGLSYADSIDEDILFTSVLGFVCVTSIDMKLEVAVVLSPQPSPLPKHILLMGDMHFNQ